MLKFNTKTLMILLALLGSAVGIVTSTWGVIHIADDRYASVAALSHTKLVVEEHILESKYIRLNSQLTTVLIKLTDKPHNIRLQRLQGKLERALMPIDSKLADVRERLRLGE